MVPRFTFVRVQVRRLTAAGNTAERLDPRMFVVFLVLWALTNALSLLLPGDIFASQAPYRLLQRWGLNENMVGGILLLDAAANACTLLPRSLEFRSLVALLSGLFWACYGATLLIGALSANFLTVVGCWDLLVGLGSLLVCVQWSTWSNR